jgi:hypothetical protein
MRGHGAHCPVPRCLAADKRRLSCLLYLNPDWAVGDGGEIRLASFLQPPVTVEPLFDRLVLFFSESMLHRYAPSPGESTGMAPIRCPCSNTSSDVQLCQTPIRIARFRVTPAVKPRHCLTIWLDSPVANEDACALPWPGMQGQIDESFAVYAKPAVQRRLARSVYAEEYEVWGSFLQFVSLAMF